MWKKVLFCFVLCSGLFCARYAHAEHQEKSQVAQLSESIRGQFSELRTQRLLLENSITELQGELTLSESKRQELETQLSALNTASRNMTDLLESYSKRLTEYEIRLNSRARLIAFLIAILVARVLAMGAGYVLYAKGVRLPRWLDILL